MAIFSLHGHTIRETRADGTHGRSRRGCYPPLCIRSPSFITPSHVARWWNQRRGAGWFGTARSPRIEIPARIAPNKAAQWPIRTRRTHAPHTNTNIKHEHKHRNAEGCTRTRTGPPGRARRLNPRCNLHLIQMYSKRGPHRLIGDFDNRFILRLILVFDRTISRCTPGSGWFSD